MTQINIKEAKNANHKKESDREAPTTSFCLSSQRVDVPVACVKTIKSVQRRTLIDINTDNGPEKVIYYIIYIQNRSFYYSLRNAKLSVALSIST